MGHNVADHWHISHHHTWFWTIPRIHCFDHWIFRSEAFQTEMDGHLGDHTGFTGDRPLYIGLDNRNPQQDPQDHRPVEKGP